MSLSAGSTNARASSGSRSSIRSIEPLMSANSAVTVLRSPSEGVEVSGGSAATRMAAALGFAMGGLGASARGGSISAVPHSPQNLKGAAFCAPQLGHFRVKGLPHSPQNLLPAGLSEAQFVQRISAAPG